jgi:nitroreductase
VPTETATSIIDSLKWRYATKKFDATKKISSSQWQILADALQLSPSSFGMQPYRFVVVTDQKLKDELTPVCWNQAQVSTCSHFVIFARLNDVSIEHVNHYVKLISETRSVPADALKPMTDMMAGFVSGSTPEKLADWATKQSYIALGNLMTVASTLKIDNCPMEGINSAEVDRILNLKEKGCSSVVACALGYRAEDDKYSHMAKVRFPAKELFINF